MQALPTESLKPPDPWNRRPVIHTRRDDHLVEVKDLGRLFQRYRPLGLAGVVGNVLNRRGQPKHWPQAKVVGVVLEVLSHLARHGEFRDIFVSDDMSVIFNRIVR